MPANQGSKGFHVDDYVFLTDDARGESLFQVEIVFNDSDRTEIKIRHTETKEHKLVSPMKLRRAKQTEVKAILGEEHTTPRKVSSDTGGTRPRNDGQVGPSASDGVEAPATAKVEPQEEPGMGDVMKLLKHTYRLCKDFLPGELERRFDGLMHQRDRELLQIPKFQEEVRRITKSLAERAGVPWDDAPDSRPDVIVGLRRLDKAVSDALEFEQLQGRVVKKQLGDTVSETAEAKQQLEQANTAIQQLQKNTELLAEAQRLTEEEATSRLNDVQRSEQQARAESLKMRKAEARSLEVFWRLREDFYRALHRGIGVEQGSSLKRLKSFRRQSLEADTALLEGLGCELSLGQEALGFARHAYEGAEHRWYDVEEGPVPNGGAATVFLPGWRYGDVRIKPSLGRQEISESGDQ